MKVVYHIHIIFGMIYGTQSLFQVKYHLQRDLILAYDWQSELEYEILLISGVIPVSNTRIIQESFN
jgi:hypothetical protein